MDGDRSQAEPAPLRASDADRERALDVLSHALVAGQLTAAEHGDRVHAALEARTVEDLRRLTSDLLAPVASSPFAASWSPPGWYPDPEQPGLQRYFDGTTWTLHRAPLPTGPYGPFAWGRPLWKGAQLGRPATGPGALADPGRRLAARLLDGLLFLPVAAGLVALAVSLTAPYVGPIFPPVATRPGATTPTPGFVWLELVGLGALVLTGLLMVVYETVATARFGRTLGKAWLHIRPLRTNGAALGWGRSFGRVAIYWLAGLFSWLGLLDPLWCLWDENRQCLHDKVVDGIVVNDATPMDLAELAAGPRPEALAQAAPAQAPSAQAPLAHAAPAGPPLALPMYVPQYLPGPFPVVARTNGLAVASFVCSLVGFMFAGVPSVVGVAFGFVARTQIRRSSNLQNGGGLALAGIIVGFAVIAFWVSLFALSATLGTHQTS